MDYGICYSVPAVLIYIHISCMQPCNCIHQVCRFSSKITLLFCEKFSYCGINSFLNTTFL